MFLPFFDITIPISASTQILHPKSGISILFFEVIDVGDLRKIRGSSKFSSFPTSFLLFKAIRLF